MALFSLPYGVFGIKFMIFSFIIFIISFIISLIIYYSLFVFPCSVQNILLLKSRIVKCLFIYISSQVFIFSASFSFFQLINKHFSVSVEEILWCISINELMR